jgi:hypothetical protein
MQADRVGCLYVTCISQVIVLDGTERRRFQATRQFPVLAHRVRPG